MLRLCQFSSKFLFRLHTVFRFRYVADSGCGVFPELHLGYCNPSPSLSFNTNPGVGDEKATDGNDQFMLYNEQRNFTNLTQKGYNNILPPLNRWWWENHPAIDTPCLGEAFLSLYFGGSLFLPVFTGEEIRKREMRWKCGKNNRWCRTHRQQVSAVAGWEDGWLDFGGKER